MCRNPLDPKICRSFDTDRVLAFTQSGPNPPSAPPNVQKSETSDVPTFEETQLTLFGLLSRHFDSDPHLEIHQQCQLSLIKCVERLQFHHTDVKQSLLVKLRFPNHLKIMILILTPNYVDGRKNYHLMCQVWQRKLFSISSSSI